MSETIAAIVEAHRSGAASPEETVARSFARIRAHGDPAVFISLRQEDDARARASALRAKDATSLPLYGVPVAIKDNMDLAGLPTTAGCPAFAYRPKQDATVVTRLEQAGAVVIGKTNLDQFATGLVGVRSPYGTPRNPLKPGLIPGGSNYGSAVAVSAGLVPVALGTDTAGSGRVPAMLNNIVGLKPSLGLVSTYGVVPACRTLDCVSVFGLTVDDAWTVLQAIAGPDPNDPYSRARGPGNLGPMPPHLTIGVPRPGERLFFGDAQAAPAYDAALARLTRLGARVVEIEIEPFYEAARLLYEGPWLAERYVVTRALIASSPESMHPVTREIILAGARPSAVDAFTAFYQLEELRRAADHTFTHVDALALPTAPRTYTIEQVLADPIELNSRLGVYTNFVNLLDLCGLAVPAGLDHDRTPFGITLLAPAGCDAQVAAIGRCFHADTGLNLGARDVPHPPLGALAPVPLAGEIPLVVVGAHLSGMPLNGELRRCGARFLAQAATAPHYRLYALTGTQPSKPGLLRVASGTGTPIEVEVWALGAEAFGRFVAAVPAPLSIGKIELADGRFISGFLAEADAVSNARDISHYGGWRAFVSEQTPRASAS